MKFTEHIHACQIIQFCATSFALVSLRPKYKLCLVEQADSKRTIRLTVSLD